MERETVDASGFRMDGEELAAVWREYAADREGRRDLHDRLVEHYFPYVCEMAERMIHNLPSSVDVQDLISAGSLGLLDAVTRFEPDRKVMFETFSRARIYGAIMDDLRRTDWVPRPVRQAANRIARVRNELEVVLGHPPCDEEMAAALKLDLDDFRKLQTEAQVHSLVPLDRGNGDESGRRELDPIEMVPDARAVAPLEKLVREEVKAEAMRGLSEDERKVLVLYYDQKLSLKEIGEILGKSESRICQIHSKALDFLREKHRNAGNMYLAMEH